MQMRWSALQFLLALMLASSQLHAALDYQQEFTMSSFKSEQETKDIASQFVKAAKGDPDLKIINIRYTKENWGDKLIAYNAIFTCHVSQCDKDILRIQEKMVQNNDNLVSSILPGK